MTVARVKPMGGADVSARRRAVDAAPAVFSAFPVALVVARSADAREPFFGGLIRNLFLAWIPFGLAIVVYAFMRLDPE